MKFFLRLSLFLLMIPAMALAELADGPEAKSFLGRQWSGLRTETKTAAITVVLKKLEAAGVHLAQKTEDYINAVDWMLIYEPQAADWTLGNILAEYVYQNEPANRSALERLKEAPNE